MARVQPHHERCTACNLCVLACSFHHEGSFGRRSTSISILKDEDEGRVDIVIHGEDTSEHLACDECRNEHRPLCVDWCPTGALFLLEK